MQAYQERVVEEKRELDEKLAKLDTFANTEQYAALSVKEQTQMTRQLCIMHNYSKVLGDRMEAF